MIRPTRITVALAALAAALALAVTGVGAASASTTAKSGGASGPSTKTLHMAFNADMQVPDPDIFYEVEGNEVVTSAYEGLVRYKPNSAAIEGALATSWTVSPDGLTYTFKLRPNVKFQTGPAEDANSWIASFKRRTDLGSVSAPGYMLAAGREHHGTRPADVRRHAEGAGQRLPRLPGGTVRSEGGRPGRGRRARRGR